MGGRERHRSEVQETWKADWMISTWFDVGAEAPANLLGGVDPHSAARASDLGGL